MTPYAYKAKQERREALEAQTAFELQAQYQILLFQKKA
jgi:23S rRNA (guanine745-N1)-methyltransferase